MNNKLFKVIFPLLLIVITVFSLTACKTDTTYSSIEVTGVNEIIAGQFNVDNYSVVLTKNDGTTEEIPLTLDMINASDYNKLNVVGEHTIKISYANVSTTITIKVIEQINIEYTQIIVQGPTKIKVGEFDTSLYDVVMIKRDGTTEKTSLTLDMISANDYAKLNNVGSHVISVSCHGLITTITITVVDDESTTYDNLIFEETSSGTLQLSGIKDKNINQIEIPASFNGKAVTAIGEKVFENCKNLLSVFIPESITEIGAFAFSNCQSLAIYCEIKLLPSGWDFNWNSYNCPIIWDSNNNNIADDGYEYIYYQGLRYKLKDNVAKIARQPLSLSGKIIIPEQIIYKQNSIPVIALDEMAFANCNAVSSLEIPDNITEIDNKAFIDCYSLESITIGNNLERIGDFAFDNCKILNDISLPSSLISIGRYAFNNCYSIDKITIPVSVKTIDEYAFYNTNKLTICCETLEIPSNWNDNWQIGRTVYWGSKDYVDTRDDYTYRITTNNEIVLLSKNFSQDVISLPSYIDELPVIGFDKLFAEDKTIKKVVLGDNIKEISDYAFKKCSNLEQLVISKSLTSVGHFPFDFCDKINAVYAPDIETWLKIEFKSYMSNPIVFARNLYIDNVLATDITIPEGITQINNWAFRRCNISSVTIPETVIKIGDSAFSGCENLEELFIPKSVTEINDSAFAGCKNLTVLSFDNESLLEHIGSWAFQGCESLISLSLPDNLQSLPIYAFDKCDNLKDVTIGKNLVEIEAVAFLNCPNLKNVYYKGTEIDWRNISIGNGNENLTNADIYYYSEEQPVGSGKYWHFVDGKPVAWIVESSYTHNTYTSVSPENWNSLTYSDDNEKQIIDYINSPFFEYDYVFDSNGNIVKGEYDVEYGAATALTDVTSKYADEFGYSKEAKGYAWQITLRNDLRWDDGNLITAADFVYSMQEQLNPLFRNYRSDSYYYGDTIIHNAQAYAKQGLVTDETVNNLFAGINEAKAAGYTDLYLDYNAINAFFGEWFGATYEQLASSGYFKAYFTIYDAEGNATNQTFFDKYDVTKAENKQIKVTDEMIADYATCKDWNPDANAEVAMLSVIKNYEYKTINWSEVGMFTGDTEYDIVLCLDKPLELLNSDGTLSYKAVQYLASLPLVKQSLYESCKKAPADNYSPWESYYNSSVETSASWGPYKLTSYEYGKNYILERNPYWYGYTANLYEGQYQTDKIVCETIGEWQSAWLKFQQGKLDGISMDTSISFDYKNSKQAYFTPSDYVASFQLQSDEEALKSREKAGINKTILTYTEFRKALSLGIDRAAFANACTTSSLAGFGLFNDMHYYDVDNGKLYRESDAAKQALCNVYGVDPADFGGDLDKAVASITGYDLAQAKALVNAAYNKAIADGKMNTGDRVQLVWGASADNENTRRAFEFVKYSWTELMKGTRLEGKFELVFDAHFGDNWANDFRSGAYDVCAGGWTGAAWDPGYFLLAYLSPNYMYSTAWDTSAQQMTFTMPVVNDDGSIENKELTMSLMDWYNCLNGIQGCAYDWSANAVSQEVRLPLIAALEKQVLLTYYTLPMYNDYSASLMSFKTDYISYEYNTFMAYGGIRYMTYNYNDSQWNDYVQSQGGMLNYR